MLEGLFTPTEPRVVLRPPVAAGDIPRRLRCRPGLAAGCGLVRLDLEGVEISAGGWRERCETEIISAGAYVVAVTTVIPSRRLALASSYLSELAGQTAAAHMCLTVRPVRFEQRTLHLAGSTHARGCLLDHAVALRELLVELLDREDVRVEVDERALQQAERVWEPPPG